MALFKRGRHWNYDFYFRRQRFQGSTYCSNKEAAKMFLAQFRTNLAHGLVGLVAPDPPPTLSAFLKGSFLDHVQQNAKKPRTKLFYEDKVKRICESSLASLRLDKVDELAIQAYKETRITKGLSIATINGELRTLRKAMIFADDCGLIRYKRIRQLPGEKGRMFVLSGELEKAFLDVADYPLKQVAILMLDLGLRTGEAVSLRKADLTEDAVTVPAGKTHNARRSLPQTARTRAVLDLCKALFPDSEWVFPGRKGNHYGGRSLDNLFAKVRKENGWPEEFILYSCRHTFATRLAESGAQAWEIKELMGHSSVKISERYIHPSAGHTALAMRRKELYDKMLRGEVTAETTTVEKKTRSQAGI